MSMRKALLGRERPNQAQLKAISRLNFQLGLLIFSASVLGYFFPNIAIAVSVWHLGIGFLLSVVLWLWAVRMLKGVKDT